MKKRNLFCLMSLSLLVLAQATFASGFPHAFFGDLSVRLCSINIPSDQCGYFIGQNHVDLPNPVPSTLQSDLNQLQGKDICGYLDGDTGELAAVAKAPCAI